jgi:hypothetical protein
LPISLIKEAENIQDSYPIDVSDGPDTSRYEVDRSRKIKDYFTGCLPWPQNAYSAYKGVRRYFNKPRSYKPL